LAALLLVHYTDADGPQDSGTVLLLPAASLLEGRQRPTEQLPFDFEQNGVEERLISVGAIVGVDAQYSSSPVPCGLWAVGVRESLAYGLVQQYKQDSVHDG
jgi:hypothetical protein